MDDGTYNVKMNKEQLHIVKGLIEVNEEFMDEDEQKELTVLMEEIRNLLIS